MKVSMIANAEQVDLVRRVGDPCPHRYFVRVVFHLSPTAHFVSVSVHTDN